jgi:hypothetical protein
VINVRTWREDIKGDHNVRLQVKQTASSAPQYSNSFVITVIDPCKPVVCADVSYFPISDAVPEDIFVKIGEGYVPSESQYWTTSHSEWCTDKKVWVSCGVPTFQLMNLDGDPPYPLSEFLWRITHSSSRLLLEVRVQDEMLRGQTFKVCIKGLAPYSVGTGSDSKPFKIIVSNEIVLPPDMPPVFEEFPANLLHIILVNKPQEPQVQRVTAVCRDEEGEVEKLTVSNEAEFIESVVEGPEATFYINLSDELDAGFSEVTVECTDSAKQKTS